MEVTDITEVAKSVNYGGNHAKPLNCTSVTSVTSLVYTYPYQIFSFPSISIIFMPILKLPFVVKGLYVHFDGRNWQTVGIAFLTHVPGQMGFTLHSDF